MVKKKIAKQRLGIIVAAMSLTVMTLTGCGTGKAATPADSDAQGNDSEIQQEELESGKVELKVWAEEGNFDTLGKMIESFKQEYAGQADFEIILEASADGETRNNVLGDIHNSADIFSMPDDQLYSMIAGGALSPVANQEQVKNANLEEAVDSASYKGTLYAYPYSADNGYFLYYDKNYFTEEDVKTMDGILAVAEAAEKKFSMEYKI